MNLLPFLIASFLFINPVLEWVFRRYDLPTEKLQFWVMLTSGTALVLALAYFFLNPINDLIDFPSAGTELLPRLVFSHDWISASVVFSVVALIFFTVLNRQGNPQSNAWLAGLGGACVIGLVANTVYALGLAWTIVEGFHFYFTYQHPRISSNPRKYLPIVLLRLSAPATLILLSLTESDPEGSGILIDLGDPYGLALIAVGLISFLGWFLSYQGKENEKEAFPGAIENWIPASLSLILILRGGTITGTEEIPAVIPLILASLLLLAVIAGILVDRTSRIWFLCCGLMVTVSASNSGVESALSWGLVMMLPGIQFWKWSNQPNSALIPLALAGIGLLPLPFLPSWSGISAFSADLAGVFLGLSYGILLGNALIVVLRNWGSSEADQETLPLLTSIGGAALLISQGLISLRLDLISQSQDLIGKPVLIWVSVLGLVPVLILGNRLPLRKRGKLSHAVSKLREGFENVLTATLRFMDQFVNLIARIFEGQGGLIWALLIGLLLITLINLRGG